MVHAAMTCVTDCRILQLVFICNTPRSQAAGIANSVLI